MTEQTASPMFRIVSLGWGVQSWTIAAMMALDDLPRAEFLVHADTTWEHAGCRQHSNIELAIVPEPAAV